MAKRDLEFVRNLVAYFCLAVVLPLVHLYTYQTALGRIPFVSGLIPALTLICVPPLLWFLRRSAFIKDPIVVGASMFLLYVLVHIVVMRFGRQVGDPATESALFSYHSLIVYKSAIYLLIGVSLRDVGRFHRLTLALWGLMVVNTFTNIGVATALINFDDVNDEVAGLYLFMGDSFAIWSILAISSARVFWIRLSISVVSVITLFLLASRTSLYSFLCALLVIGLPIISHGRHSGARILAAIFALVVAGMWLVSWVGLDELLLGRMVRFFSEGSDTSWSFREWQLQAGWNHISASPLFGDYGSDLRLLGRFGDHIHNFLEVWRQFGVLPFLLVVFLCLVAAYRSLFALIHHFSTEAIFAAGVVSFVVVEIAFSRSWGTPYVFLAFGLVAGFGRLGVSRAKRRVLQHPQGSWQ